MSETLTDTTSENPTSTTALPEDNTDISQVIPAQPPGETDKHLEDSEDANKDVSKSTPPPVQKFKFKSAGEEKEIELDTLIKNYQRHDGLDKRLNDIKKIQAEIDQKYAYLNGNPLAQAVLQGQDPYQIAERLVWERMQEERLPPERRAALQAQRQAQALQTEIASLQAQREALEAQSQAESLAAHYEPSFREAMTRNNLPITSYTLDRVMYYLKEHADNYGWDYISPEEIVKTAKEALIEEYTKGMVGGEVDQIIDLLGMEYVGKLSQAYAKRLKPKHNTVDPLKPTETRPPNKGYVSEAEFDQAMKEFRRRGE